MPLKTYTQIRQFFETHNGSEFVGFQPTDYSAELRNKIGTFHVFQDVLGNNKKFYFRMLRLIERLIVHLQMMIGVDRRKSNIVYGKGNQWFLITEGLAQFVVSKEKFIRDNFRMTSCADEIFLQTVILNSNFKNALYNGKRPSLRYTDWNRGNPYTFRLNDFEELVSTSSDALFARKFSSAIDEDIIKKLYDNFANDEDIKTE